MNKKMYLGLGILIIFVTIAGFVFIQRSQKIGQLKQEATDSIKQLKESRAKRAIVNGNTQHDAPHKAPPIDPEPGSLTAPKGHYYPTNEETGDYYLNEDGEPILMKKGQPFITIETFIGFAPTKEVYNQYLELSTRYEEAKNSGNSPKASELKSKIDQIVADSQGELPEISTIIVFDADVTQEKKEATLKHINEVEKTALKQVLMDMELIHLYRGGHLTEQSDSH
ncbi:MAG: hypothetical protein OXI43_13495 [Candidatus Poribacteria bacterium]|nr:hypothetical protein [Candidatus Poribacteria bacterium]